MADKLCIKGERVSRARSPAAKLFVVIVNYRLASYVERLLERRPFVDAAVLLVDNASEPERMREIATRHGAELLLLDRNHGFAGAVNRAVQRVPRASDILLVNPDVELTQADVVRLRQELTRRGLTGVSPLLVNRDGSIQVGTAGGSTRLSGFAFYFLFVAHLFPSRRGVFYTRRQLKTALEPRWLCMACLLVQAEAFRRFGPIPETEGVYAEDMAWGWAASHAGARFAVVPDLRVTHEQGAAGAGELWRGALMRLALRENGPVRGHLAAACMTFGLAARRLARALGARPGR